MFVLSYVKANYYDRWNNSVHAQAFGGLVFESREEIEEFKKTLSAEDYIIRISELKENGDWQEIYNFAEGGER